jgi:hypothetical protein
MTVPCQQCAMSPLCMLFARYVTNFAPPSLCVPAEPAGRYGAAAGRRSRHTLQVTAGASKQNGRSAQMYGSTYPTLLAVAIASTATVSAHSLLAVLNSIEDLVADAAAAGTAMARPQLSCASQTLAGPSSKRSAQRGLAARPAQPHQQAAGQPPAPGMPAERCLALHACLQPMCVRFLQDRHCWATVSDDKGAFSILVENKAQLLLIPSMPAVRCCCCSPAKQAAVKPVSHSITRVPEMPRYRPAQNNK